MAKLGTDKKPVRFRVQTEERLGGSQASEGMGVRPTQLTPMPF